MALISPSVMLDHVGRHGRLYMSLGALIGLLLPPLASLAAPLLLPALLVTTIVALVRVDWRLLRGYAARPLLLLPMVLGSLLLSPLLVAALLTFCIPLCTNGATLLWLVLLLPVKQHC